MVIRSKTELITAFVLAAFGGFVISEASRLPYTSEFGPGPGFFPLWVGIGIFACSLVSLWPTFFRGRAGQEESIKVSKAEVARALGAWLAFVISVALLSLIGFALSLGLLSAYLVIVLDRRPPLAGLAVALGLSVGFYLVFVVALGVSLPVGPMGF